MKKLILVLAATSLVASPTQADEGLRIRYRDVSGRMSVTVHQDIDVGEMKSLASRDFSFDLALAADPAAQVVTVTIDRARASFVAHGQKQRLGTRHLTGKSFPLSIGDEGRQLEETGASDAPVIGLGPYPPVGFSVASMLADSLPVLSEEAVAVGATWATERPLQTLEGWGWSTGQLASRHRVTAVERHGDRTVVSVSTEAEASLRLVEDPDKSGTLKRSVHWTFDATAGRLLSASIEQETEGVSLLPQGEVRHRQRTRIELGPRS